MNLIKPFNYFQWCTERADGNVFSTCFARLESATASNGKKRRKEKKRAKDGAEPFAAWNEKFQNSETVHVVRATT